MSFIPKNPLSFPEIEHTPSTPLGTRGLFAKEDGFYEVDSSGKANKHTTDIDRANSLKYYGNAGIIPSAQDLFNFEIDVNTMTATVIRPDGIDMYAHLDGFSGDITIPYEYKIKNGKSAGVYKVTKIGNAAFYWSDITDVHIPNTITEIGVSAFGWCQNLKSITLPASLLSIEESAFGQCSNLTDVYFKWTKTQWDSINIGADNLELTSANIHYDHTATTKGYVDSAINEVATKCIQSSDWNQADETKADYIKNKPSITNGESAYSIEGGYQTLAGSKAFTITNINEDSSTFTLDDVAGLKDGMEYSFHIRYTKLDESGNFSLKYVETRQRMNFGTILSISGKDVKVSNFPTKAEINIENNFVFYPFQSNENFEYEGIDEEVNTFRIIAEPTLGTRSIGYATRTDGYNNQALSKGASSKGEGNISYGSYSDTSGKNNKAGYCAFSTGIENHSKAETAFTANRGNVVTANQGAAFGSSNEVNGTNGFGVGNKNKLGKNSASSFVGGEGNFVADNGASRQSFTFGKGHYNNSDQSAIFGLRNKATKSAAFVVNSDNEANAVNTAVFGQGNTATTAGQMVRGRFSEPSSDYIDIVGYGEDKNNKKNIYTLSKKGVGWFAKGLKIGGAKQSEGIDVATIDTVYGDEIDNKWNYNTEAPMMMYHISNGYDRSPFEECFILNKAYPCPDSEDSFYNMQIAISKDGKIKYRYANDDALDTVDWYEDATPTKLSQLKDDIGFDDVKTMYDTLMDGGYNTDKIISAFESAFEGRQIANENVERIESVESSIAEFGAVISEKEDAANKITSILQDATDTQYPSAKASYKAIENAKDTAMRYADSITKDFIFGSEIDEKYNADSVIPQILTYYSSGYDNAPFSTSGIIITSMADETGEDEYGSYKVCPQWAISELGELKYRMVTYGETNYRTPWSENLIPTKLSQLKNDTGYLEPKSLFGEQLFYNEIDTKYYPGKKNIPLVMTYDSRNRDNADEYYENAPFFQCTIITMHQECFYGDMENINYTSYQIATDGCSIKVRWGAADNTETFESIPWVKIPSADDIDELEDKIGDIETALDSIIEIQNALIGGDA